MLSDGLQALTSASSSRFKVEQVAVGSHKWLVYVAYSSALWKYALS